MALWYFSSLSMTLLSQNTKHSLIISVILVVVGQSEENLVTAPAVRTLSCACTHTCVCSASKAFLSRKILSSAYFLLTTQNNPRRSFGKIFHLQSRVTWVLGICWCSAEQWRQNTRPTCKGSCHMKRASTALRNQCMDWTGVVCLQEPIENTDCHADSLELLISSVRTRQTRVYRRWGGIENKWTTKPQVGTVCPPLCQLNQRRNHGDLWELWQHCKAQRLSKPVQAVVYIRLWHYKCLSHLNDTRATLIIHICISLNTHTQPQKHQQ